MSKKKRIHYSCEGRIEKIRPEDRRLASRGLPITLVIDSDTLHVPPHPHASCDWSYFPF